MPNDIVRHPQQRTQQYRLNQNGGRIILAIPRSPAPLLWRIILGRQNLTAHVPMMCRNWRADEGPLPADWAGEWRRRGIDVTFDCCAQKPARS
jgi:hypothetical protein